MAAGRVNMCHLLVIPAAVCGRGTIHRLIAGDYSHCYRPCFQRHCFPEVQLIRAYYQRESQVYMIGRLVFL